MTKKRIHLPLIAAITATFLMLGTSLAFASVWTDQADYTPGSVVTISGDNRNGAGYLGGETVAVDVSGPNGYTASCEGLADENGAWSCQVTLLDTLDAVGGYTYTATGQLSGVTESGTFTDAININSFASGCSTPGDTFANGVTVCAKATGLPGSGGGSAGKIEWWAPGAASATRTTSFTGESGNSTDSWVPAASPDACGTWTLKVYSPAATFQDDDTFVVTCVTNNPPTVNAGGPYSVNEGGSVNVSATGSDPEGTATLSYAWDLDNNGSYETSGQSATFDASAIDGPATLTIGVKVTESPGGLSATATATVYVLNVAPTATFNNNGPVNEGSDIVISLTSPSDPSSVDTAAGFTYAFDCGSGYGSFGATNSADCSTNDNGTRTVKGKIKDKDGGVTEYTASVTINNVAPTATFGNNGPKGEGSDVTISFTSPSDVSGDLGSLHYAFSCSDADLSGTLYASAGTVTTHSCNFDDGPSAPKVSGAVMDKDGGITTYETTVTVHNVAPTATFSSPGTVNEGSDAALSLNSPSDPSTADTGAGFTYAFDCGSGYGSFGASNSANCPTTDNGMLNVGGKTRDKDDGATEYTGSVTVNNVAPTASLGNDGPVDEGSAVTVTFSGQFDSSSVDTAAGFHYAFDCDGGSLATATYADSTNTTGSTTCTFPDGPATETVIGIIIDKDGGKTQYSTEVTVNNVAPDLDWTANPSSANEGDTKTFTFSISDPGIEDFGFVSGYPTCGPLGTVSGTPSIDDTLKTGTFDCTFPDGYTGASSTVKAKVNDETDDSDELTQAVAIANVIPSITSASFGSAISCSLGSASATLSFSFTDPGADTWDAKIDWDYNGTFAADETKPGVSKTDSALHSYITGGVYTAAIKILDKDGGLSVLQTANVTVNYNTSGILQPVNWTQAQNDPSIFKWGSTLPVKVQFFNCDGTNAGGGLSVGVQVNKVTSSTPTYGDNETITNTNSPDGGGYMRWSDPLYIYNLNTKSLADKTATYRITLTVMSTGQTVQTNFGTREK